MKKTIHLTTLLLLLAVATHGQQADQQQHPKFDAARFDTELQEFITTEAHLTTQEAAKFFPVYKEMQQKQRQLFARQRELSRTKPTDEAGCASAIRERDEVEIQQKRLQQTYHGRFLELLPASKVYDILTAEDRFHRRMMHNMGQPQRDRQQPQHDRQQPQRDRHQTQHRNRQ